MKDIIRAISIRQPYVEMILTGKKKNEYRSRSTKIRETVYLYASRQLAEDPWGFDEKDKKIEDLPRGCIIGTVEIVDCVWDYDYDCYAYVLKNPKRLEKPLFAKNKAQPVFWRPVF